MCVIAGERERFRRHYTTGFEGGGRGFEPRNTDDLQQLEKTENGLPPAAGKDREWTTSSSWKRQRMDYLQQLEKTENGLFLRTSKRNAAPLTS